MTTYWHKTFGQFKVMSKGVLIALAIGLVACGETARTSPSNVVSIEMPRPDPAIITGTLANGLRYSVKRNQTPPQTVALRIRFAAGSLNEPAGKGGLAHYLEHMAFNGSKNVPEGDMIKILERNGLSFGADTNAHTGVNETVYKLNLPTVDDRVLDTAFMIMRETAENLTLDQAAIDRELGIIQSEKRARNKASYRAWEARMGFLTQTSDLMDRLPIGTDESLTNLSADDFRRFYDGFYRPENTIISFVGDAEPDMIISRIKETFSDWAPRGEGLAARSVSISEIEPARVAFYAEKGLQTDISLYALRPFKQRADSFENRREALLLSMATNMMNTRVRDLSDAPDAPFLSAGMTRVNNFDLTEGVNFYARAHKGDWESALSALDMQLRQALKFGFSQAEFENRLERLDGAYAAATDNAQTRDSARLADGYMRNLHRDLIPSHPRDRYEWFKSVKPSLSVEEVNASFRLLWGDIEDISVFMQRGEAIDNAEASIRAALQASRRQAVKPRPVFEDVEFAYTDFGPKGEIVKDEYIMDADSHLIKFRNNVRLNFKQTGISAGRILIKIEVGDGNMSTPRKDEGLRRMAQSVVNNSGLAAHDPAEFRRLLSGKMVGTHMSFSDASQAFTMISVTVPQDLDMQMRVSAAKIIAPAFTQDARQKHIKATRARYPSHDATINGVVEKVVERLIRGGDKRFGFDNEAMFYAPTLEEIEAWLRPQFRTGLIEITVIGDVDKGSVINAVASTFGALPERKDQNAIYQNMNDVRFPAPTYSPLTLYHKGDANQAQIRVYWPAPDGRDIKAVRELDVLRGIMRNRLTQIIREDEAATYSAGVGLHNSEAFEGYGYLNVVLNVLPEKIDPLFDQIDSIASDIASGNISQDEFDRAITPIQQKLDASLSINTYWMTVLSDAQTGGFGLQKFRTRANHYETMTLNQIKAGRPWCYEMIKLTV